MLRRLPVVLLAGLALFLGLAGPASATPPVTETVTEKGVVETFVDVVPICEGGGPLYTDHHHGQPGSRTPPSSTTVASMRRSPTPADSSPCPWRTRACPATPASSPIWGGFNAERHPP